MKIIACLFLFLNLSFSLAIGQEIIHIQNFFESGEIKSEGYLLGDSKTDYWKYYYRNGQMLKEGRYSEGKQSKYWFYFRMDGTKIMEGHFSEGRKTNWWIFYNSNNQILKKCEFKDDLLSGYCLYYDNGEIAKAERYNMGVKEGEWTDMKSFKRDHKQ